MRIAATRFSLRRTGRRTSHMRPLVATPNPWHYWPKPARTNRGNPMKLSFVAVLALASAAVAPALADDKIVEIGVLTDLSSLYADDTGLGSVLATELAVEDSGLTAKGWKIDVISADHQNKPDIGAGLARKWFDEDKVDMVADVPNSGVGLAVNNVVKEKNGVYLNSAAATSDLTGKACTPNTVHWTYDTYMLAHGTGQAVVKAGGDSWFFLTADYAFGKALQRDTTAVVEANGGKVLGSVNVPLNTPDWRQGGGKKEGNANRRSPVRQGRRA